MDKPHGLLDKEDSFIRWGTFVLILSIIFLIFFASNIHSFELNSSSQLLWGADQRGDSEPLFAEYLKFSHHDSESDVKVTGYGRATKDLGDKNLGEREFRRDEAQGRLYYLYLDFSPADGSDVRVGRQFVNFTAESSVLDGITLDLSGLSKKVGVSASAGSAVKYSLDEDISSLRHMYAGIDVHLINSYPHQMGVSFVRRYDSKEIAAQKYGFNASTNLGMLRPYVEAVYSDLTSSVDEATVGAVLYKGSFSFTAEFFTAYPSFDSTSIYSVFAVDPYSEYLLRADYSFNAPVTMLLSYARETYGSDVANAYGIGVRTEYSENLNLSADLDYRLGYGGSLWGTDINGDYRIRENVLLVAGYQYDTNDRDEAQNVSFNSQRYWFGSKWAAKKISALVRIESNSGPNFKERSLARVTLDYRM